MPVSRDRDKTRSDPRDRTGALARRLRFAAMILPLFAIMVLLSACTFEGPTMTIQYKSPENREIWGLYSLVWWLAVAVFVVVETMLFYSVIRFRRKPGHGLPRQVHGNNRLEVGWTIVPTLLLVLIAVPTVRTIINQSSPAPADAVHIRIIGHQFWWEVRYPDPAAPGDPTKDLVVTANEIHLPVNKTADFEITSHDVQHSFWVPLLGGKMDVYPNRTNYLKYTPDEVGKYFGQCAELCGTAHGFMKMYVFVEEQGTYDQWFAAQRGIAATAGGTTDDALIKKGQQLVTGGACATCHTINGTSLVGKVGPNLSHFGSRTTFSSAWVENNEANLKIWIHNPDDIKPGVTHLANEQIPATGDLYSRMPAFPNYTDEELTAIARYLLSLK